MSETLFQSILSILRAKQRTQALQNNLDSYLLKVPVVKRLMSLCHGKENKSVRVLSNRIEIHLLEPSQLHISSLNKDEEILILLEGFTVELEQNSGEDEFLVLEYLNGHGLYDTCLNDEILRVTSMLHKQSNLKLIELLERIEGLENGRIIYKLEYLKQIFPFLKNEDIMKPCLFDSSKSGVLKYLPKRTLPLGTTIGFLAKPFFADSPNLIMAISPCYFLRIHNTCIRELFGDTDIQSIQEKKLIINKYFLNKPLLIRYTPLIIKNSSFKNHVKGVYLASRGETIDKLQFIVSGTIELQQNVMINVKGQSSLERNKIYEQKRAVLIISPGEVFGEEALGRESQYCYDAICVSSEATILEIDIHTLRNIGHQDSYFIKFLRQKEMQKMKLLAEVIPRIKNTAGKLASKSLEISSPPIKFKNKYSHLLHDFQSLDLPPKTTKSALSHLSRLGRIPTMRQRLGDEEFSKRTPNEFIYIHFEHHNKKRINPFEGNETMLELSKKRRAISMFNSVDSSLGSVFSDKERILERALFLKEKTLPLLEAKRRLNLREKPKNKHNPKHSQTTEVHKSRSVDTNKSEYKRYEIGRIHGFRGKGFKMLRFNRKKE